MQYSPNRTIVGLTLAIMFVIVSVWANSTIYVKPGNSIQSAIEAAGAGEIIMVQNGTFLERVNLTKPLTLKGINNPIIDAMGGDSAITISANGSNLLGFIATGSGSGANDAGIRVLSNGNVIRDNTAIKNKNNGIILSHADKNSVFSNSVMENENNGIFLFHSDDNSVWGNNIGKNWNGIYLETSRGNTIKGNNLSRNDIGINISNYNLSESIITTGKGVSISYHPSSQLPTFNINKNSTSALPSANMLYQNNLLNNGQNAFDDGHNQWDNGKHGNHYSNYDAREQGCKDRNRDGICDSSFSIPGGHNLDNMPKASADAILSYKSKGLMGTELKMDKRTYMPDAYIDVKYKAPMNFSGWLGVIEKDLQEKRISKKDALSSQSFSNSSGLLKLKAPAKNGSYDICLYNDLNGEEMVSLNFDVRVPAITANPTSVNTCELITATYTGAPGYENDWIAMYKTDSPDANYISKQPLNGDENGTAILYAPDQGNYNFRMFENDTYSRLATSNNVEVKTFKGTKVEVSPSQVSPGGTVTVSYWGAPSSGTGIIGMYGMNRPDKFPLEKRAIGSNNCGRMTWRLPSDSGRYDFRMFYSDITDVGQGAYQLLGQSNIVTVS